MTEDEKRIADARAACLEALVTDGEHHKQWYLEQILLALVGDKKYSKLQERYEWEEGMPP